MSAAAGSLRERIAAGWKSSQSFFFGVATGPVFAGVFYLLGSASGARRRDVTKQETAAHQQAVVEINDRMEQWDRSLVKDVAEMRNLLLRIDHQLSSYGYNSKPSAENKEATSCDGNKQKLGSKSMDG